MVDRPPPESLSQPPTNLTFLLAVAGSAARRRVDAGLAHLGLGTKTLALLAHLNAEPGLSYSELARRSGVTVQTMTSSLKVMERDGLVAPIAPLRAGRRAELELTAHGADTLKAALDVVDEVSNDWLPLDAQEKATFASLIARVARAAAGRD